jgi:hypothetical protein
MSDVERIAKGLTKAQREALLEPHLWLHPGGQDPIALIDCKVDLRGPLARAMTMQWDKLTPLGLAVRDYLKENFDAG